MIPVDEGLHRVSSVLFICTGNYYRSRYAEARFEHWAANRELPLRAASRGLAVDFDQKVNKGPLSPHAMNRLRERGINADRYLWMPRDLAESDLENHELCIAVDRDEHVPLMKERFPGWVERVEYWDVKDGVPTMARHPLAELDHHLDTLFDRLSLHR